MNVKRLAAAAALVCLPGLASAASTKIDVWHVFNLESDMMHEGIKAFNAANPDVQVEARILPFAQLRTELVKAIATGDVPDVAVIDNPEVASFAYQGALEDITADIKGSKVIDPAKYYPGPWASVTWQGKVYGVPRASNTLAIYYNADMFKAKGLDPANPPKTWAELTNAAAKLTDKDKGIYGIAFSAVQSEESTFQWLPFLYQAGGSVESLASPAAVRAMQFWTDLVKKGYASKDVVNMRQYEGTNTLIAGNAGMAISGPWELPRIDKEAKFDWRVALLPTEKAGSKGASALGGYDWVIPKGAKHKAEALRFIEYMSGESVLRNAWNTGRLPSRSGVTTPDPKWPQAFATFSEQMKVASARGPHPKWPEISKAVQTAIQESLTGVKTPEQALKDAAAKVDPILAKLPLR